MVQKIFGYDWEDIQCVQQKKGSLTVSEYSAPLLWNENDEALFKQHPSAEELKAAGWHGTADRLERGLRPAYA